MAGDVYQEIQEVCLDIKRREERLPLQDALMRMMDLESIPMHHPYHHYLVPAVILTQAAIERGVEDSVLCSWLTAAKTRAKLVPGGICGEWGTCGAAVGVGIAVSILTGANPKSQSENWKWARNCAVENRRIWRAPLLQEDIPFGGGKRGRSHQHAVRPASGSRRSH